jgi:hypothetical protein
MDARTVEAIILSRMVQQTNALWQRLEDLEPVTERVEALRSDIDGHARVRRAEVEAIRAEIMRLEVGVADALARLPVKGDPGERGEPGERGPEGKAGPKGESIVGPVGPAGRDGRPGKDGDDGVSVAAARMDAGDLVLSFSDGTEARVGRVRGGDGSPGPRGPTGTQGPQGPRGEIGVTVSNSAPSSSDGTDGDVWFQI